MLHVPCLAHLASPSPRPPVLLALSSLLLVGMDVADMEARGGFCAGPFWDLGLTWETDDPDFTPCFHETVVTMVPVGVLLLLLPVQIAGLRGGGNMALPWTLLLVSPSWSLSDMLLFGYGPMHTGEVA